jgi:hypothetical protein
MPVGFRPTESFFIQQVSRLPVQCLILGVVSAHLPILGDYPGLDLGRKFFYSYARQASATLLGLVCFLFFAIGGDANAVPSALGPHVPLVPTSTIGLYFSTTVKEDVHCHPRFTPAFHKNIFVLDETSEDVATLQAHKGMEVPLLIRPDSEVVGGCNFPFPIDASSPLREISSGKKCKTETLYGSRHSASIYNEECKFTLIMPVFYERISEKNIRTFDSFCCLFSTSQSEPSDYSQSIGKIPNSEIGKLHFTTKQSRGPIFYFGILGCVIMAGGVYIFGFNGSGGLIITLIGVCILILCQCFARIKNMYCPESLARHRIKGRNQALTRLETCAYHVGYELASLDRRSKDISVLAIVISELEFRDVQRHIFCAHLVECANDAALEDGPEALNRVGVDCADHILALGMVNDAVREFLAQLPVACPIVGAKQADLMRDGFTDKSLKRACLQISDDASDHIPFAADGADDWGFTRTNTAPAAGTTLIPMLVLFLANDKCFVDLNNTAEFLNIFDQGNPDLVTHFPSGLIGTEAHVTHDLQGAHTLLTDQHEMGDLEPIPQRLVRVLEDRAGNVREAIAGLRSALVTLPAPGAVRQPVGVLGTTARATNAFWPSARHQISATGVFIWKHRIEFGGSKLVDWLRLFLGHLTLPVLTGRIMPSPVL